MTNNNQTIEEHILEKYQVVKKLGSGAYGHVWKVIEKLTKKVFALKKIFEAFQHSTDAQRTYRQVSILKKISHTGIAKMEQIHIGKNERDIYLLFQYMETDLYHGLYEGILQPVHKKYIMYQVLQSLKYLHESGLIHRDLKPSNILLNSKCQAKICDFGLARLLKDKHGQTPTMTEGVATRWYRAPQVLLGSHSYNQSADIWSFGCMMGEIALKNPLFPGSSTINQLQKILHLTGKPSAQDINSINCQYVSQFIQQCGNIKQKPLTQIFGHSDPYLIDLIEKILKFNPKKRLSINQIFQHEYFAQFFSSNDLTSLPRKTIVLQIEDQVKLTPSEYILLLGKLTDSKTKQKLTEKVPCAIMTSRVTAISPARPKNFEIIRNKIQGQVNLKQQPIKSPCNTKSPCNKSPQRFSDLKKVENNSFSKLLGSQKSKKRGDSRDSSFNKDRKNVNLFTEIIKNNQRTHDSRSKSRIKVVDKQNMHANINSALKQNCVKKFEPSNSSTPRTTFQALKKTSTAVRFGQKRA